MGQNSTRQPAVADQFYPANPSQLKQLLSSLPSRSFPYLPLPKILIFPHAGLIYSGPISLTSANHWQKLPSNTTIILLGASHHLDFPFLALDSHSHWQTPLGKVSVDLQLHQLFNQQTFTQTHPQAHAQEHSLELPLITLQNRLTSFKILPLLLSNPTPTTYNQTLDFLTHLLSSRSNLYLAISTDLSHYLPYPQAQQIDFQTLSFAYDLQPDPLLQQPHRVCGFIPLSLGLKLAQNLHLNPTYLLYQNSGDTSSNHDQVVGYSAFGFTHLNHLQQALNLARFTLEHYLATHQPPHLTHSPHPDLDTHQATFVTLKTTPHHQLRGCIGNYLPLPQEPTWQSIIRNTIAAAVNDPRFSPMTYSEIHQVTLEVSLLSQPQPINSPNQIKLGTHGVILRLHNRQALFLPEVATEHHLSLEEFLSHLAIKAGLPPNAWQDPQAQLQVFTTQTLSETDSA